ncbi:5-oxoprolinase subunit PxpB [Aliivibrio fischeri]|uniref:5-oxoprolinase subunit PxpB n=1 Tax=Aliivibrio fischeri TaxID=668 RepID=UPI0007C4BE8B|nr:5-oxoprolinase subunit PxpB [Aliivibrio fischeri]
MMKISAVNESTLLLTFADKVSPEVADMIAESVTLFTRELGSLIVDIVPSYTSILITYDTSSVDLRRFMMQLRQCLPSDLQKIQSSKSTVEIELPVYYGKEVSLDANEICEHTGLSFEEVVSIHSSQTYRVYAIGFAPGFAYLGNTDSRIHVPRKSTPRLMVPAGSLAIAEQQTAIYPKSSPGGWQIIGRTPVNLIDFNRKNLTLFEMGAKVTFVSISRETYIEMGGELPCESESVRGTNDFTN